MSMKILHVVNSLEVGGLEKFVVDLANKLTAVDHFIACLRNKGDFFNINNDKYYFLNVPPGISVVAIFKLIKIIQANSIDVVHTHNQGPQFYGSIAGKLMGKAVVHTKHGQNRSRSKRRFFLDKFSSYMTDIIVAVSTDAMGICLNKLKIPQRKVVTVKNGIDTNVFYKFPSRMTFGSRKSFIIGVVGRLAPEKNHKCLLDACSILLQAEVDIHLKIVGDGPLKDELMSYCSKLGLDRNVNFLGTRKNIQNVMNSFDLFVLPSLSEGISLTLLEAMSCELPVIATRVGGNSEVVVDGETGFLIPPSDPNEMALAISKCINSPNLCHDMGKAARERVKVHFSMSRVAQDYLEIYKSIVH